jgi:two-component system, NarL family, sensor kinase
MEAGQAMDRVEAENRLLHRVIETITSSVELDTVLAATVELVTEATGGDACFLHLWEPERERLVLRAATPEFSDAVGQVTLALGEGVSGWVAATRDVVLIPEDKWADPRYKYFPDLHGELFTAMLSVPVSSRGGELVGVFNVHSRERRDFTDADVAFLRLTASLIAGAIEHANLFRTLAEQEAELEFLVRRTIEMQEEDRRRVATEIHDGVTQQLVSVWYRLQAVARSLRAEPDRAEHELAAASSLVDDALEEARAAIYNLRPSVLDDLGLGPSLRTLALQLEGHEVELAIQDVTGLPPHHEVALYRIAQEAVTNVRKHADASAVRMWLEDWGDEVALGVRDDGRGFETHGGAWRPATSFGLTGMRERVTLIGGTLEIRSAPGEGTDVEVRIPKDAEAAT